jgi:hypothetical protein
MAVSGVFSIPYRQNMTLTAIQARILIYMAEQPLAENDS